MGIPFRLLPIALLLIAGICPDVSAQSGSRAAAHATARIMTSEVRISAGRVHVRTPTTSRFQVVVHSVPKRRPCTIPDDKRQNCILIIHDLE